MNDQSQKIAPPTSLKNRERGFSVLELILVLTVIGIVSSFAYVRLAAAREVMRVTNSSREFTNFVQKARLDSIRRHATTAANKATVVINNATTYTVTGDFDGNGVTDSLRQLQQGVTFSAIASDGSAVTLPITITFDWRGRAACVDSSATPKPVNTFSVADNGGTWTDTIAVTSWGDASVSSGDAGASSYSAAAEPSPPNVSAAAAATVKSSTVIP
ncbi:MAG: pilus assembly FimT family protein [Pyrinomonadaceae bacterium]